jgi:nucleotide-binding universal stress UspA family protein
MRILLALDPSAREQPAVTEVALRPWPAGSTVEVLSVVDIPELLAAPMLVTDTTRLAQETVQAAARHLSGAGLDVSVLVLSGDAKDVILDRANKTGADFIVVGPHRGGGLAHFLLGGVAKAVIRLARCSVEIARPGEWSPVTGHAMRVLLATDGSESAMAAARSVAQRPWPSGTEVRVFSAIEVPLPMVHSAMEPPFVNLEPLDAARADATKHAQEAAAAARRVISDAGLKTEESVPLLLGHPKQAILDEAQQWGADLIVIGSHGRRGINRLFLGSVSEAVAMHAACSVDVIRALALPSE